MKHLIFFFGFLFFATVILATDKWPQEPKGFRGIDFGTNESTARKTLGIQCIDSEGNRLCGGPAKIGDVDITNTFLFLKDKLVQVSMTFDSDKFASIKAVFIEKYGEPMKVKKTTVQNQNGDNLEKESLAWESDKVMVFLTRYSSDLTRGLASIATQDWLDEVEKQQKGKGQN